MDTAPINPGDVNDLERRLAEWQPSSAGLEADRMLFAAGRASVRPSRGRFVWPLATSCFAVLAAVLGVHLAQERSARLELLAQIRSREAQPSPRTAPQAGNGVASEPVAPDSYLAARQALARNTDVWQTMTPDQPLTVSSSPCGPIWRPSSYTGILEP